MVIASNLNVRRKEESPCLPTATFFFKTFGDSIACGTTKGRLTTTKASNWYRYMSRASAFCQDKRSFGTALACMWC